MNQHFSCRGIEIALAYWEERGHRAVAFMCVSFSPVRAAKCCGYIPSTLLLLLLLLLLPRVCACGCVA